MGNPYAQIDAHGYSPWIWQIDTLATEPEHVCRGHYQVKNWRLRQ